MRITVAADSLLSGARSVRGNINADGINKVMSGNPIPDIMNHVGKGLW